MLLVNPRDFCTAPIKVWRFPCGCVSGRENSDLAKNKTFLDRCAMHQKERTLPDIGSARVEFYG